MLLVPLGVIFFMSPSQTKRLPDASKANPLGPPNPETKVVLTPAGVIFKIKLVLVLPGLTNCETYRFPAASNAMFRGKVAVANGVLTPAGVILTIWFE